MFDEETNSDDLTTKKTSDFEILASKTTVTPWVVTQVQEII